MRNHNTTPQPQRQEILTTGDFVRAKTIGKLARWATEAKIDRYLKRETYIAEDEPAAPGLAEQNEAYLSYRDNLVESYATDKAEAREYRKDKRKHVLKRIGSAAMWVPGLDVIGSKMQESYAGHVVDKEIKRERARKNGGFMGSTKRIYNSNKESFQKESINLQDRKEEILRNHETWSDV